MTLTEPQERALLVALNHGGWTDYGYRWTRSNTIDSLERQGLAESRIKYPVLRWEWRLTPEGVARALAIREARRP